MEKPNTKRKLLKTILALPLLASGALAETSSVFAAAPIARWLRRTRPGDSGWPTEKLWRDLAKKLQGRLLKLQSPFAECGWAESSLAGADNSCEQLLRSPYTIGDQPALTQTSGWIDAWQSQPSAYAVAAVNTADIVAAVNFSHKYHLRLVIKGGGHSYVGASSAPDSLLIWTRAMHRVGINEAFVPQGMQMAPQPAVTVEAGALWSQVYAEVTTRGGRYVQGGGCTTVGVAGLVQSGGFSNFSKKFGTAAGNLLEAEIVTADGVVRIANAVNNPDLFWAIKGGGGGSFGVVTRLTLRTYPLPNYFGAVIGEIKAATAIAYRTLVAKFMEFYHANLFNPHWGETVSLRNGNKLGISLVFQGLDKKQVEDLWAPFWQWVAARTEYSFSEPVKTLAIPAQHFWNAEYFRQHLPGVLVIDDRPGASPDDVVWKGDTEQAGWFIHGYHSVWLPAGLLGKTQQSGLVSALIAASHYWDIQLHFNKGLAGASEEAIAGARDSAMNPAMIDAFALAIIAGGGKPAYVGMPVSMQENTIARERKKKIAKAAAELTKIVPNAGAYLSESNYFQAGWQAAYWGRHYPRLAAIKQRYDPQGLFFVHHGVGSEEWSCDGFTRK